MATKFEKLKEELAARNKERGISEFEHQVQFILKQCKIFDFVSEYQVDYYFIDIAFPDIKLALELDGYAYHSTPEQLENDKKKNDYLIKNGWEIIRLPYSVFRPASGIQTQSFFKCLKYIWDRLYPGQMMSYGLAEWGGLTDMLGCENKDNAELQAEDFCNVCKTFHFTWETCEEAKQKRIEKYNFI